MSLSVRVADVDHPYANVVENFFAQEYPGANLNSGGDVLEHVFMALLGSGQFRYGPLPSPESQVSIRQVLRKAIECQYAIPILVPYGSRKSVLGEAIDLAEVGSLRQLACLQHRVKQFYAPGIRVIIRLEDTGGHYLFDADGQASRDDTTSYCNAFKKLVSVLGYDFIEVVLESELFDETEYRRTADSLYPTVKAYLRATEGQGDQTKAGELMATLLGKGWRGNMPQVQREFYYRRYRAAQPDITPEGAQVKLARYFSGSWARIVCRGVGADPAWAGDYIRVTFVPPVPGVPEAMTQRYVYYRTLPLKYATSHMPPWRSKGYLKLNGVCVPKIASWNISDGITYTKSSVVFGRREKNVEVRADFVIES